MRVILTPRIARSATAPLSRCLAVAAECRRRSDEVLFACAAELHGQISSMALRSGRFATLGSIRTAAPAGVQYIRGTLARCSPARSPTC